VDNSTVDDVNDCGGDKERAMDVKGSGKRRAEDDSGDAHLLERDTRRSEVSLQNVLPCCCMRFICVCLIV
jgi:hypothetical protein